MLAEGLVQAAFEIPVPFVEGWRAAAVEDHHPVKCQHLLGELPSGTLVVVQLRRGDHRRVRVAQEGEAEVGLVEHLWRRRLVVWFGLVLLCSSVAVH